MKSTGGSPQAEWSPCTCSVVIFLILYLSVESGDVCDGGEEELAEGRVGVEEEDALQVEGRVLACN